MFRLVTSQLIESGGCRQIDIIRTFGVSKSNVIRYQNLLRKGGSSAFFKPRKVKSGGRILTKEILVIAQSLLDEHHTRSEVCQELNIKYDTVRKAIKDGRLKESVHLFFVKSQVSEFIQLCEDPHNWINVESLLMLSVDVNTMKREGK